MSEATKPTSASQTSSPSIQAAPLGDLAHGRSPSPGRKPVDPAPERVAVTMSNTPLVPVTETRPIENSYLIILTEAASLDKHLKWMKDQSKKYNNTEHLCKVVRQYGFGLKGYSANLSGPALDDVKNHPDVNSVAQDIRGSLFGWLEGTCGYGTS